MSYSASYKVLCHQFTPKLFHNITKYFNSSLSFSSVLVNIIEGCGFSNRNTKKWYVSLQGVNAKTLYPLPQFFDEIMGGFAQRWSNIMPKKYLSSFLVKFVKLIWNCLWNVTAFKPPIHTPIKLSTSMIIHKMVCDLLRKTYVNPYSLVYYF